MPKSFNGPYWDYDWLLRSFGGDDAVARAIRSVGYDPPPLKTIAAWRQRNSVPGKWAPLLIDLAMRKGLLNRVSQLSVL
jgi:hypothetical protein